MTKEQIDELLSHGSFPEKGHQKELIETHISWVIICDEFVYKIKKPVQYPFLDFSTIELRKYYCHREIELNQRLSQDMYLEVLPVSIFNDSYTIGESKGQLIDYAVKMRKLDPEKQMDVLLENKKVKTADIKNLAKCIATFHKHAKIIHSGNVLHLKEQFNDLQSQKEFLTEGLGQAFGNLIDRSIETSNNFLRRNDKLLRDRLKDGFFRDCHGDLHTRNIFLLPKPLPFDCLEFNDDYRQIDILNEVAFLCMDLDAMLRKDLSRLFIEQYDLLFPAMRNKMERQLFVYYKSYRANVRAKVNSLRASSSPDKLSEEKFLAEAEKYLKLMESYHQDLYQPAPEY